MDETQPATTNRSAEIGKLAAALAKAQAQMSHAEKGNVNPHFKSRYADLASVWEACRSALTSNELAILQPVSTNEQRVTVTTLLVHSSGEWVSEALTMTALQNTPQAVGSTITYGRRYGLSSMVGVAPDDDDGNAASGRDAGVHPQAVENRREFENRQPAVQPAKTLTTELPAVSERTISVAQAARLFSIANASGWKEAEVKNLLVTRFGVSSSKHIPVTKYDAVIKAIEAGVEAEVR